MSWALSFTGQKSVINEAYHRVALHVNLESLQNEDMVQKLTALGQMYFLHIYVSVPAASLGEKGNRLGDVLTQLQVLTSVEHALRKKQQSEEESTVDSSNTKMLFNTVEFPFLNEAMLTIIAKTQQPFDVCMISPFCQKIEFVELIRSANTILKASSSDLKLGIGHVPDIVQLDWILCNMPLKSVEFVQVGALLLPNLQLRVVDLIHSFGYNTFVFVNTETIKSTTDHELFQRLAKDYSVTPETVLIKSLLQLGTIPCIDYLNCDQYYIADNFARTVHPFVHRKLFVSAIRVISLYLTDSDMESIRLMTEVDESLLADKALIDIATTAAPLVKLSHNIGEVTEENKLLLTNI